MSLIGVDVTFDAEGDSVFQYTVATDFQATLFGVVLDETTSVTNFLPQVESDHADVLTFEVALQDSMKDMEGNYKLSFIEAHKRRKVPNPESQSYTQLP
jgi:hypothetical protein